MELIFRCAIKDRALKRKQISFIYGIDDFVYLSLTGEEEHGLRVAAFSQADSRFLGGEAPTEYRITSKPLDHMGLDAVNAKLTHTDYAPAANSPLSGGNLALMSDGWIQP